MVTKILWHCGGCLYIKKNPNRMFDLSSIWRRKRDLSQAMRRVSEVRRSATSFQTVPISKSGGRGIRSIRKEVRIAHFFLRRPNSKLALGGERGI